MGLTVLAFLLNLLIVDFFYYWMHRFQHENPILWQEHKLHNMDEQLCALIRESPLEPLVVAVSVLPMTILFKLDAMQGAIAGSIVFAWGVFIHSNIRVSWGSANCLIASPQVHRIHHSRLPEHFDCNYAVIFPLWDVLFGTYYAPQRGEYPETGVHDETEVESTLAGALLPFREWRRMFLQWRDSRARDKSESNPTRAVEVYVERGKCYYWCACGRSKKQPFCDGSHRGTEFSPLPYRASESGIKWFCICKQTKTPPFCDCSHRELGAPREGTC